MAPCQTNTEYDGSVCVMTIMGTLYHEDVIKVSKEIKELYKSGVHVLIIDLSQLGHLHSKGLGALISALKNAREQDAAIAIFRPSEKVKEILKITKLDQILPIYYDNLDYVKKIFLDNKE